MAEENRLLLLIAAEAAPGVAAHLGRYAAFQKAAVRDATGDYLHVGLYGPGAAAIVPALFYLFRRVEQQFTGAPTLLILDEAWLFLTHPVFAQRLQSWLKTLRKKNVFVIFATQEVADASRNSALQSTILSACPTKIFLADPEAMTPAMAVR